MLGPKYHPLKPGAWTHASPLGDGWIPPAPATHGDPTANAAAGEQSSSNRYFTRRWQKRRPKETANCGGTGDGSSNGNDNDEKEEEEDSERLTGERRTEEGERDGEEEDQEGGNVALFMMMGAALQPVARVPAGNVLALAGLEGRVNKCATLTDTPQCPAMRAVTLQAKPMVRVAVEALHQQDMDKLELGLSRLYQADPAVEVGGWAGGGPCVGR